jgi:hypothetical protein
MGKIFASYSSDKGLIIRIYRELKKKKKTSQRINNPANKWANELNKQFSKEVQMANKCMKKFPTSLGINEMQIKTTLRFYLTAVKMAIINNKQMLARIWGKGKPLHC